MPDQNKEEEKSNTSADTEATEPQEQEELSEEQQRIKKLEEREKELEDKYQRISAELENYKKRQQKMMNKIVKSTQNEIIAEFLDIKDHLDRALESAEQDEDFDSFHEGIKLIEEEFSAVLENEDVEELEPEGSKFDPLFHDGISKIDVEDEEKDGKVLKTIQRGYVRNDNLLRPAQVVVGKYKEQDDSENEED